MMARRNWRECETCVEVSVKIVTSECVGCRYFMSSLDGKTITVGSASARGASILTSWWLNEYHDNDHRTPHMHACSQIHDDGLANHKRNRAGH